MKTSRTKLRLSALSLLLGFCAAHAQDFTAAEGKPAVYDASKDQYVVPLDETKLDPLGEKIGYQLLAAAKAADQPDFAKIAHIPEELIRGNNVLIELTIDPKKVPGGIKSLVEQFGGTLREAFTESHAEASMPISAILTLSEMVESMRLAQLAIPSAISEAKRASNADWWHSAGNVRGRGIKIAVIDSFDSALLARQQSAGEVPAILGETDQPNAGQARLLSGATSGADSHGNKILEALFDIAPEATYILVPEQDRTPASIRAKFVTAIGQRPDIISASLSTMMDGYNDGQGTVGSVSRMMDAAHDAGITVVAAAGNLAQSHWAGEFRAASDGFLNWNFNTYKNGSGAPIIDGMGMQSINTLVNKATGSECLPNGEMIYAELGAARNPANTYLIQLVRQGADRAWYPVALQNLNASYSAFLYHVADSNRATLDGTATTGTSIGCAPNTARYGLRILKRVSKNSTLSGSAYRPLPGIGDDFLNFFVVQSLALRLAMKEASLAGIATSPKVITIGAADCGPSAGSCTNLRVANYSSQGPVLNPWGYKPQLLDAPTLYSLARYGISSLKPDVVSFAGVATSMGVVHGTSIATPHAAGIAALLMQRYPSIRGNPILVKETLTTIAKQYDTSYGDLMRAEYRVEYSYAYGQGLLRLQKETSWNGRGRVNYAVVGRTLTTSPTNATSFNGSQSYVDNLGTDLHVRFLDEHQRPVLYPVLVPSARIVNGPSTQNGFVYSGGSSFQAVSRFDPASPAPLYATYDSTPAEWAQGYFFFPNLRVNMLPPAAQAVNIGRAFNIQFEAYRFDGMRAGVAFPGEALAGDFNVCTPAGLAIPSLASVCPAL